MKRFVIGVLVCSCSSAETTPEPPPPGATVSYSVCIVRGDGSDAAVEGMVWSVMDHPEIPAAMTDAAGCVELGGLPPNEELLVSWTKDGYTRRLSALRTGSGDFDFVDEWAHSLDDFPAFEAASGIDIDTTKAWFSLFARDDATEIGSDAFVPDIRLDVAPSGGEACYYGPLGSTGCTTESDNLGVATIFNLEEGSVEVTVGPPGIACTGEIADTGWQLAWSGSQPGTFRVPLRREYETFVSVDCHK